MARYEQSFKDKAVARLLAPESAAVEVVSREIGVAVDTRQRWSEEAQSMPAQWRAWTARAWLEAVITTAAMDETGKSAWCRQQGVYPTELAKWCASATAALAEPEEARACPQGIRHDKKRIKELERDLVEDAADSLGSYVAGRHTGTFGMFGTLSFNGNKVITTGGGGMSITNDEALVKRAKYITTTAKTPHPFEFVHYKIGYSYHMPNLNVALGCAQMARLPWMLEVKEQIANQYCALFEKLGVQMTAARPGCKANSWLNSIILTDEAERDALFYANVYDVMTRPIWRLSSELDKFTHCQRDGLENSRWLEERMVNVPSSVPENAASPAHA